MTLVGDIDKIAFSTAFEIDKIYDGVYSGSFSVPASTFSPSFGTVATKTVAQAHGAAVLPVIQFSIDSLTWYDGGTMIYAAGTSLDKKFTASCYTTSSTLVIVGQNFSTGALTCYYRAVLVSET